MEAFGHELAASVVEEVLREVKRLQMDRQYPQQGAEVLGCPLLNTVAPEREDLDVLIIVNGARDVDGSLRPKAAVLAVDMLERAPKGRRQRPPQHWVTEVILLSLQLPQGLALLQTFEEVQ